MIEESNHRGYEPMCRGRDLYGKEDTDILDQEVDRANQAIDCAEKGISFASFIRGSWNIWNGRIDI